MIMVGVVLVMGASGIIAQLLLLRELLITFLSNELSIGVVLANWLVLEAAGSYLLGRAIEKFRRKEVLFVAVTLLFSISFPLAVTMARTWKTVIGILPGEGLGLDQIFVASMVILFPVSLTHGALFTFSCRLLSSPSRLGGTGIGRVYFLENVGTLAGGLVFTYLMITTMNSVEAAWAVSLVNSLSCLLLLWRPPGRDDPSERGEWGGGAVVHAAAAVSVLLASVSALVLFGPYSEIIHRRSVAKQWQGQKVVHYQNSVYGNMAVIERGGEYTFFSNGIPAITTPAPDVMFVEEFAHLPLLHHPDPRRVLVISGGAGGVLREILKHPVEQVDYTELDPLVLRLLRRFPTELTDLELGDRRVRIHYRDGRLFLKETSARYDLVLVGLSNPRDLQLNRFFTRQFFSLVNRRLNEGGVLAFTLPGSLNYLGEELRDLNACVLNTLEEVFPAVRAIPGDGSNLLLASSGERLADCGSDCVEKRFDMVSPATRFLTPFHIRYRLDTRRADWFASLLEGSTRHGNDDLRPLGVYYSLSWWNAKFAPHLQSVVRLAGDTRLSFILAATALCAILALAVTGKMGNPSKLVLTLVVLSTGFTGMILDLALLFTFQSLYGVVFHWIGLLVTAFMAGTAFGSHLMTRFMESLRSDYRWMVGIEALLALFALSLPLFFTRLGPYLELAGASQAVRLMFLVLSFCSGLLIGGQFPLAGKLHLRGSGEVEGTAGTLYGADLLGGWVGGVVGGVLLFPVLGLTQTCLFLGVLKTATLVLCLLRGGEGWGRAGASSLPEPR